MSSSPQWMPLHVADYLRDTGHLTVAEHGAYMLLIMRYWQDGGLPSDETLIRRYSLLSAEQWSESRPVLAALFDEGWKHKRVDQELAKAAEIIDKRRAAAEQRHSKSNAHAEQMESKSSYVGVPPSPSPLVTTAPSVPEPVGARVEFEDVWEAFPRNPSSSREDAKAAFERTKPADRPDILAAAMRRAKWFAQDCEARGRTLEEGERYEPHLANWLKGKWRDSLALPVKGETDPSLTVVQRGTPDFKALERLRKKPIQIYGDGNSITVTKTELEQARTAA